MGKRLTTSLEASVEYITAISNTFGGPDKFTLVSMIYEGKGQIRMPAAGEWLVNVYTRQEVTADNDLKHLAKKCDTAKTKRTFPFSLRTSASPQSPRIFRKFCTFFEDYR